MKKILLLVLTATLVFCQTIEPQYIILNGDVTDPDQEVSGLAWQDDNLILLPQYPKGKIFSIPKQEILEFLDSTRTTILPNEINWNSSKLDKKICGFEGFESIIFYNDTVFITIEAERRKRNHGYLARGLYDKINNEIIIDRTSKVKIKPPVFLRNMTFETILRNDNFIITIYEVNAQNVNASPVYSQFNMDLELIDTKSFPFTEFRITDATELDDKNKFWVTNYFWPGDFNLLKLASSGQIEKDVLPVERLLEFQIVNDVITRTDTHPINIKLSKFGDSRNWEGIVRIDDRGFLIVTDKFPGTVLAFVPYPK